MPIDRVVYLEQILLRCLPAWVIEPALCDDEVVSGAEEQER
jgi:hypothetical protein